MKSLLVSLLLIASSQAFAAGVVLGSYDAVGKGDADGISVSFTLGANGKLALSVSQPLNTQCTGTYAISGNTLTASLQTCNGDGSALNGQSLGIDVTNATGMKPKESREITVDLTAALGMKAPFTLTLK